MKFILFTDTFVRIDISQTSRANMDDISRTGEQDMEVTMTVTVPTYGKPGVHDKELAYRVAGVLTYGLHKDVQVVLNAEEGEILIHFDKVEDDGHAPELVPPPVKE